jgi:dihydrofolate reductase
VINGIHVSLIWAMSRNRVIGRGNTMPWRLHTDMQHYRRTTMGKPVIMGRKTFESIGRPLPGRLNIVLTRAPSFAAAGTTVVHTLDDAFATAVAQCEIDGRDEFFVIGGTELYALSLPHADRLYVTEIDAEIDGDTWFPAFDASAFTQQAEQRFAQDDKNSHAARIRLLVRAA